MRFWDEDGRLVAWSWVQHDGRLEYDVHPDRLHLLDEILATADARSAFAFADDGERRAALERHGFTRPGDSMHYFARDWPSRPGSRPFMQAFATGPSARAMSRSGSRSTRTCGRHRA
jgi:hypothetical protein